VPQQFTDRFAISPGLNASGRKSMAQDVKVKFLDPVPQEKSLKEGSERPDFDHFFAAA
jgi:hypothetical protein